jgi:prephenate dehydratase
MYLDSMGAAHMKKIGYLGPPGTFTQEAALKYAGDGAELVCYDSLGSIMAAVESGEADEGVVPLENSTEGSVVQTMDLLAHRYDLKIKDEVVLGVSQYLLARPGVALQDLTAVMSHPQALAQCRVFLEEKLPGVRLEEMSSTSEAARMVSLSPESWGAVAPGRAGRYHGLEVLWENIQDCRDNATRFAILGRQDCDLSPGCKTSLIVTGANRPGSLYGILREFALREINLARIESRPAKKHLGEYLFFIDLEGHRAEPLVSEAIASVAGRAAEVKIIGSYPADPAGLRKKTGQAPRREALAELRAEIDMVDAQIVDLLGIRTRLVARVAGLKDAPENVRDPVREEEVIQKVKRLAKIKNTSAELVEDVYRLLMEHFVAMQKSLKSKV